MASGVNVFGNLQEGSTLPSRGNGCNVQIGQLQCEWVKLWCFLKARTSPSLVSTVRTRMLLFTWASGVLVSRLVSEAWTEVERGEYLEQFKKWMYIILSSNALKGEDIRVTPPQPKITHLAGKVRILPSKIWYSVSKKHVNPHISYGYWWYLMIHDFVGQRIQTSELQVGKTLNWNGDPGGKEKGQQQSLKNKLTTVNILTNTNIYTLFYYSLAKLWLTCSPLPPTASCRWRSRYPGPVWRWEGPGTPAGVSPSPPSAPGSPPQDGSLYLGNQWSPWRTGPPSHGAGVPETHSQGEHETDRAMNYAAKDQVMNFYC